MILRRLFLKGFLSFREPTEIVFADAPVWMLSGPNGSGKSSVFDALTYALFAAHRGGKQNAEELINKEADGLVVELDLELGPETFRVRRTHSRGNKSTRQVLRRDPEEGESWPAVSGTERDDGFKTWVRDHLGLSYETFTASVLLTQGGAERLIASSPADRLVVLKGIVGLDRYEGLQKKADDRRKALEAQADAAKRRIDGQSDPGDDAIVEASRAVEATSNRRDEARATTDRLANLAALSARWDALRADREAVQAQLDAGLALKNDADAIARDRDRLVELRAVVPQIEAASAHRSALIEAESRASKIAADRLAAEATSRNLRTRAEDLRRRCPGCLADRGRSGRR